MLLACRWKSQPGWMRTDVRGCSSAMRDAITDGSNRYSLFACAVATISVVPDYSAIASIAEALRDFVLPPYALREVWFRWRSQADAARPATAEILD